VDFIGFLDENLMTMHQSSGKTWLTDIARMWIEEGLQPQCIRDGVPHDPDKCSGVHWGGTSHATLCSPEVLRAIARAGCSHLVYGYESFSPRVMKTIGKGATPEANERSLRWTLEAGIRPIPNQMMGFPDEDFDSLRDNVLAWNRLGLQVKPFFATPYPGTEWYQQYKDRILEQYDGDLEAFLLDVGDATRVTAVISKKFNAVELYGLRELMVLRDLKRLARYEQEWNRTHPVDPLAREKQAWAERFGGRKERTLA
jgi:anaerobic magnesium-protoporphyrin IX monomethyl ester cyclase